MSDPWHRERRSAERAFVIQFEPVAGERRRLRGRVEQVASGEVARFRSTKQLVDFMRATLRSRAGAERASDAATSQGARGESQ